MYIEGNGAFAYLNVDSMRMLMDNVTFMYSKAPSGNPYYGGIF
jgi:hypothetical protein